LGLILFVSKKEHLKGNYLTQYFDLSFIHYKSLYLKEMKAGSKNAPKEAYPLGNFHQKKTRNNFKINHLK